MLRRTLLSSAALALALGFGSAAAAQDVTRPASSMSGPSATAAGPTNTTRAASRSKSTSATRSRPSTRKACPRAPMPNARSRRWRCRASRHHLHHLLRLHGPDVGSGREISRREVRARHRLQAAENVATYSARFYEGRAIQGHIAGSMTKTDKIGYIASYPIPEVIRGINSAYIHASKVNPDVEFSIIWAYTWFDPAKEADAARADRERRRRHPAAHRFDRAAGAAAEAAAA